MNRLCKLLMLYSIMLPGLALAGVSNMGPLNQVIEPGLEGAWRITANQEGVRLQNQQSSGDLTYYYGPMQPEHFGQRTASVSVRVTNAGANALAGLLYGLDRNSGTYFLFTVGGDGMVNLHYRHANGFELRMQSSLQGSLAAPVQLKISERGREITLWANGQRVGSIEDQRLGQGALGIAAADIGNFAFSNFRVGVESASTQSSHASPARPASNASRTERSFERAQMTMHDYIDPNTGIVQRRIPLPPGWQLDSTPDDLVSLRGPNNIIVYQTDSGRFISSNDPHMLQTARMSGQQISPVIPLSQFIEQNFSNYMQSNGYRQTRQFQMPRVREFWERFGAAMPQGLSQKSFDAIGVEWQGNDGTKAFTILVLNVLSRPNMVTWNVAVSEVYAPAAQLEHAKQTLTYVAEKTQVNPHWQIVMNQRLIENIRKDQRIADEWIRRSQIAHAQRMNSILARGESSRQIAKINSDILDSSHASYLRRDNMVTKGHQNYTRMLSEQSLITNRSTGELYEVDAGYGHHWVSSDGLHLATENSLYDPRTDSQMNQAEWSKFEVMR